MTAFLDTLKEALNPEQFEAATHMDGPTLVLAGAGSGKTRVLVHRVAYLIEAGRAHPWEVMAVTFTNKAAGEMRARLEQLVGPSIRSSWIGTFHSLAARMLRLEGHRLGYTPGFTIYDTDDARRAVKRIMTSLEIDPSSRLVTVSAVSHEIDRAKNQGLGPSDYALGIRGSREPVQLAAGRIYPIYEASLLKANAVDFGGLLMRALELLAHHPEAKDRLAHRFRHVLVDEFQDTNRVQYSILRALVAEHGNLTVVGDDDQAIYRWRGADVGNILGFPRDYPSAKIIKLERNYRSTGHILAAANAVIRRNRDRHGKSLWTSEQVGEPIGVAIVERSDQEAALAAELIRARIEEGAPPSSIAVLYRANAQSRLLEDALRRLAIPYMVVGGTSFFERAEVKDILAYLRLTVNPCSAQDFDRVANTPPRGIGDRTLARLRSAALSSSLEGARMLSLPDEALLRAGMAPSAIRKLRDLDALLASFRALAEKATAVEVAVAVIKETHYVEFLEKSDPATSQDRTDNVWELVNSIAEYELDGDSNSNSNSNFDEGEPLVAFEPAPQAMRLAAYLERASLATSLDLDHSGKGVALITLHGAKGLEFPHVFIVGMEEGTFPSRKAGEGTQADMEEERRLFYVGITRAMRTLSLLGARLRWVYGTEELRWPSRFLGELPDEVVAHIGPGSGSGSAAGSGSGSWLVDEEDTATYRPSGRSLDEDLDPSPYPHPTLDDSLAHAIDDDRRGAGAGAGAGAEPKGAGSLGRRRHADARRTVERDSDRIEYDEAPLRSASGSLAPRGPGFPPGTRVFHSTLGVGTVESLEEGGSRTYLTVRFQNDELRRVASRFVRSIEESC